MTSTVAPAYELTTTQMRGGIYAKNQVIQKGHPFPLRRILALNQVLASHHPAVALTLRTTSNTYEYQTPLRKRSTIDLALRPISMCYIVIAAANQDQKALLA